jgi:hypothetical protein
MIKFLALDIFDCMTVYMDLRNKGIRLSVLSWCLILLFRKSLYLLF